MSASAERAPQGEFAFTRLEKVVFGPRKLAELGPELARRGLRRAVVAPERFEPIAEGLRIAFDTADPGPAARACADRVAAFVAALPVPRTLSEVGVSDNQIPVIAEAVREEIELFDVLGRPVGLDEVRALLDAAA